MDEKIIVICLVFKTGSQRSQTYLKLTMKQRMSLDSSYSLPTFKCRIPVCDTISVSHISFERQFPECLIDHKGAFLCV